jgi:hypothetical protein
MRQIAARHFVAPSHNHNLTVGQVRELLFEGYEGLLLANSGELIGLPQLCKLTHRRGPSVITETDPGRNLLVEERIRDKE